MLIVMGRVAQRSIDVPRKGYRVAEHSPAVVSSPAPCVAEHGLFYTKAIIAAPA